MRTLILPIGRIELNIVLNLSGIFYLPTNVGGKFIMISFSCPWVLSGINYISAQR
jgi:hypothetical protein